MSVYLHDTLGKIIIDEYKTMSYNIISSHDKICFLILNRYKGLTLKDVIICNTKIDSTEHFNFFLFHWYYDDQIIDLICANNDGFGVIIVSST